MLWRSKQPAVVGWLAALGIFGAALAARFFLGTLYGANPSLIFYPAILIAATILGWKEASLVLALSLVAASTFLLPPGMYLLLLGWLMVGALNIAIITSLKSMTQELAASNERQRVLFRELQHRVANTLQAVVGAIDVSRRRIASAPEEAALLLADTAEKIAVSADVHRRLHDPALFERGLASILPDVVATVVDHHAVHQAFDIDPLDLTFDQMSTIAMLVIEAVNNSQKHVFQPGHGSSLTVLLKALPNNKAVLIVRDDGNIAFTKGDGRSPEARLGLRIIEDLARQIGGTLGISSSLGTEVTVEFPLQCR